MNEKYIWLILKGWFVLHLMPKSTNLEKDWKRYNFVEKTEYKLYWSLTRHKKMKSYRKILNLLYGRDVFFCLTPHWMYSIESKLKIIILWVNGSNVILLLETIVYLKNLLIFTSLCHITGQLTKVCYLLIIDVSIFWLILGSRFFYNE